jgi:hypothetical protein
VEKEEAPPTRYSHSLVLKTLSSLPRGLPSTLWGKDMDELAEEIVNAEYGEAEDGSTIVKIGKKWYYGDPKDVGTYLQIYKKGS